MTELLLCNEPMAAVPYYIEGISWNVYSLEELCYYIENNTYLLDKNFMSHELCSWIDAEVQNPNLSERLLAVIQKEGRLSEFVMAILSESGYCSRDKMQEILGIIRDMEEKSDYECRKIRADRLMDNEKYLSSIYEYKSLLESNESGEQTKELLGSIWHNLGTAYARLFLFGEAANCYEKAYRFNKRSESLKECLMAYYCLEDMESYERIKDIYQVNGGLLQEVQQEVDAASGSEAVKKIVKRIDNLSDLKDKGDKKEYRRALSKMMFQWKEEYRRICRI